MRKAACVLALLVWLCAGPCEISRYDASPCAAQTCTT